MKNCTYVFRTVLCLCLFVAGTFPGFSQQIEKGIQVSNGDYLGFLEYKPADYNTKTSTKYPLIIFLHGIGERGNGTTDLARVACCGLPRIIKRGHDMKFTWNGKTETFIVLSPQCPAKYGMWPNVFVEELIAYAKANLRIDPDRIFLTGLSMGGGGTYKYISTAPEQPKNLAAAATICAPCTFKEGKYVSDAKLPVWSFHAADDAVAVASCTESAIRKINEQNPAVVPLKTIWPTGGHIVWDRVYTDTNYRYHGVVNIYEWFLGQNRRLAPNKLPVAKAGNTINITTGSGVATLNASASTDADGKIVRYVWKKIEGPAAGIISNPMSSSATTTVTGLTTPGTYKYQLHVVDDRAGFTSDEVTVIVSSGVAVDNKLPVAKAGIDVTITLPTNSVKLDGSASSDADGTIASYTWSKVSGPAVNLASPNSAAITLNSLVEGTYVFKLKVTDNKGGSSEDQVTITVRPQPVVNKAPIARAGVNFSITLPENSTTLDGSTSEDPDGTIKTFQWTKLSGPAGSTISTPAAAKTVIAGLVEGTYIFKLKVTDNSGATGEDQITVTVLPAPEVPNVAPKADAGADITISLPVSAATLNGTGSKDEDGSIASFTWSKISGPVSYKIVNAGNASTEVNNLTEGTYQFKLRVTDNKGAFSEDLVAVIVKPAANVKPVAKAGNDINITLPTNKTVLNGSASSDADGSIAEYYWSKISGPANYIIADATVAATNLSNLSEGIYQFRLLVVDNAGGESADTVKVTVNAAPPSPNIDPVAQAGENKFITLPENSVSVDGSSSADQDGSIAAFNWAYVDGPQSYLIETPDAAITTISGLVEGTYSFRLQVTDNDGAINYDTITVVVKQEDLPPPPPNKLPVAVAGDDITITLPMDEVTLDGSLSDDEDGTLTNYSWTKLEGPDQYSIVSQSYHKTKVQNLIEGTYSFRLQVKDNSGALGYDTIRVIVQPALNSRPVSRAGADIQVQLPVNEAELDGTDSYDPDGNVTGYKWEYVSGPAVAVLSATNTSTTIASALIAGQYTFRLTVTDNSGAIASDVVKVTVLPEPPNAGPVAKAGNDIEVQLPNPQIKLDGTGSFDPDGIIVEYSWVKVSGPGGVTITNSTTATPSIFGVVEGQYVFRLTVKDDKGKSGSDVVSVFVAAAPEVPNLLPMAYAGEDKEIAYPESTISLDGSQSKDNDGEVVSFEWSLVSGPSVAKIETPFSEMTGVSELQTGEYIFELLVRDNDGGENRDTVHVSVINTMRYEEVMTTYPNPAISSLNVQLTSDTMGMAKVTIFNASGFVVKTMFKNKSQAQFFENINVSNLQTGMYYVEVMIPGKLRKISKFIKRQ